MTEQLVSYLISQVVQHAGTQLETHVARLAGQILQPLIDGQPRELTREDLRSIAAEFNQLEVAEGGGI